MTITMEEIRAIIDKETIADSGVVLQTTTAARKENMQAMDQKRR